MKQNDTILVLGSRGLVGSALVRRLKILGYQKILSPAREELDLLNQQSVIEYFRTNKPQHVFNAAAKVGGIVANNTYRGDFLFENLQIQNHVFEAAFLTKVDRFLFLGSSCIYPKFAEQPIKEESLLTGELEPTNEPYAIAKIAGLKTAENFRRQYGRNFYAAMPTNLYGINDNFHPQNSHVIPGLIQRMHTTLKNDAKTFEVWGTGKVKREFLYVDDMASACVFLMERGGDLPYWINIGTGEDIEIGHLAQLIGKLMGFKGEYIFNTEKPDGTPRKLLDVTKIKALGWKPEVGLEEGLRRSIEFYRGIQKP